MAAKKPLRILHVVHEMDWGGTETWLMHVLRHIDRDRFCTNFLVHTDLPGVYDEEIRSLGAEIVLCTTPSSRLWTYARSFKQILRERGPYDVIHSHVHHYSGYVLGLARQAGVPIRIAHSHTNTSEVDKSAGTSRRIYLNMMKRWIDKNSTGGLAVSRQAASALFGTAWEADPRWRVHYCGIDLEPFQVTADPVTTRAELGIPADAFVVGHVGRFHELKNHAFLVHVTATIAKREPNMRLLLIGDGPSRSAIERQVADIGIADKVIFAGERSDVPRLMLGAMDVFVFPSLLEGLPLACVEAQAAGLPSVLSDTVTKEVDVYQPLIRRLPLTESPSAWAEATMAARAVANGSNGPDALALVKQSHFNIRRAVKELEACYLRPTVHDSMMQGN
jgi:glycosyltransferase involved in cell wall biosynthesis